jgi:hypothetical protein
VHVDVVLLCCLVWAVWTLKRLLSRVRSGVPVEVGPQSCLERAVWTLKQLLPRVRSDVRVEVGLLCCLERAVWTLKRLLPRVRADVRVESGLPGRLIATFGAAVHDHATDDSGASKVWTLEYVGPAVDWLELGSNTMEV